MPGTTSAATTEPAGRVALVTGAGSSIGAATAELLALRGAAVLATDLGDRASATAERIAAAGGRVHALAADLADPAAAARLFDAAEATLGPVEIVVLNATGWVQDSFSSAPQDGIGRPLQQVTAASFDAQFAVDARGGALLIAELARRHVARGGDWGRVVALSSGGPDGFPGEVSYGAAKAALENYVMSAAQELGPFGVTANVVVPPVTDTGWIPDEARAQLAALSPFGTVAQPQEVAGVVVSLCDAAAARVSGNVIRMR